jgi:hypothetical protein
MGSPLYLIQWAYAPLYIGRVSNDVHLYLPSLLSGFPLKPPIQTSPTCPNPVTALSTTLMYQFFEHLVLLTVIHCSLHAVLPNRHTGMAPKTHRLGQVYLQELSLICTLMPLLAASHQFGPLEVAKGILTVALFCAPLDTSEPPSHQQSDSDDWDIPSSSLHNPSGDQSPSEPGSPSLDALQNESRRIPAPPQQQQNPAL